MQLSTALVLCALCAVASARPRQKRMVGGVYARRGQFPYLVQVRRPDYECTGTIISPSWVLTAGHCVYEANFRHFKITAGTVGDWYARDEHDEFVQHRLASRTVVHENYKRFTNDSSDTTYYDIGLLQLKKPFVMTKYVQSVPLTQTRPPYTKPCYAIGFGSSFISPEDWEKLKEDPFQPNKPKRSKRSEPLRYYEIGVPQYNSLEYGPMPCRVLRDKRFKETYQLCSIAGAPNSTHLYVGDSGGPLVCSGIQVGVYVLSEPKMYNGSLHIIEVHTAVDSFIKWIKKFVSDIQPASTNDLSTLTSHVSTATLSTPHKEKYPTEVIKPTTYSRIHLLYHVISKMQKLQIVQAEQLAKFSGSTLNEKTIVFP